MRWRKLRPNKPQAGLLERRLQLEKGDLPALLMAALATLLPAVLLVGGLFVLVIWLLFLR